MFLACIQLLAWSRWIVREVLCTVRFASKIHCHHHALLPAGPICGVIAAGLEYGDYCCYGSTYGERLRFAATFVSVHLLAFTCTQLSKPRSCSLSITCWHCLYLLALLIPTDTDFHASAVMLAQ